MAESLIGHLFEYNVLSLHFESLHTECVTNKEAPVTDICCVREQN